MTTTPLKVIPFNTQTKSMASEAIKTFLNRKVTQENTKRAYAKNIKQFFNVSSIEEITEKMLTEVDQYRLENHLNKMDDDGYATTTTAQFFRTIKCLYSYIFNGRFKDSNGNLLLDHNPVANVEWIEEESDGYGAFTIDEIRKLMEVADEEDALYYMALMISCVRAENVAAMKLQDIKESYGVYVWSGKEKGRKGKKKSFEVSFNSEFYNKLKNNANENGNVFSLKRQAALYRLNQKTTYDANGKIKTNYKNSYCYKIGISEEECIKRNLVLHSFKKTGVTYIKEETGDAYAIIKQAKNSAKYALETYVVESDPLTNPSLLIDLNGVSNVEKLENKLDEMSKEDIINLIMGANDSTKRDLLNRLR